MGAAVSRLVDACRQASLESIRAGSGPLPRMAGPTVLILDQPQTVMVRPGRGDWLEVVYDGGRSESLSVPLLVNLVEQRSDVIVFPDRLTLHKTGEMLAPVRADLSEFLIRSGVLAASSKAVVLTDALSLKFWLPGSYDRGDISTWMDALGFIDTPDGWSQALNLVTSFEQMGASTQASLNAELCRNETVLRQYLPPHWEELAVVDAYLEFERWAAWWESFERTDRLLKELHVAAGTIVELHDPEIAYGRTVEAHVSLPCRIEPGFVSFVSYENRRTVHRNITLNSFGWDKDGVTVNLSPLDRFYEYDEPLYITSQLSTREFYSGIQPPPLSEWLTGTDSRRETREVPLYVLLAGTAI